jgi:putative heme-binding domain-containing protein
MQPIASVVSRLVTCAVLLGQAYVPEIEAASKEGRVAIRKFKIPSDLEIKPVAAEPMLVNPVAFCLIWITTARRIRVRSSTTDTESTHPFSATICTGCESDPMGSCMISSEVGKRLTREQIPMALIDPGREIAKGFGTFVYTLDDATVVAGIVQSETANEIVLLDATEDIVKVEKRRIREVSKPVSSMPPMAALLKRRERRELRDFVEYLKGLK